MLCKIAPFGHNTFSHGFILVSKYTIQNVIIIIPSDISCFMVLQIKALHDMQMQRDRLSGYNPNFSIQELGTTYKNTCKSEGVMYRLQWSWDLKVFVLVWCPDFRDCYVEPLIEFGPEDVPLLESSIITFIRFKWKRMYFWV